MEAILTIVSRLVYNFGMYNLLIKLRDELIHVLSGREKWDNNSIYRRAVGVF